MRIPLVDLRAQHLCVAERVRAGLDAVIESTHFILGEAVEELEAAFAHFSTVRHFVGMANGTDAVELALRAVGVGRGAEVIVPANTFIATAVAVERAGATPILVDCDPAHHLIDPDDVTKKISPRTRAIIAVHLYGQVAPMESLEATAASASLPLIEDAAQAHGARRNGRACGTVGAAAGISFYPGKNLGAYGDGGGVLTQSDELAGRLRALRNYGSERKYHHPILGFNSRLDALQAVVLSAKLPHLAGWNEARRRAAARYDQLLAGLPGVTLPATLPGNEHVWHLYVVRVPRRDEVLARLHEAGIGAAVHYPVPIHLQGAFAHLGHRAGDFPAAEAAAREVLSLPLYPEITVEQQQAVADALRAALG